MRRHEAEPQINRGVSHRGEYSFWHDLGGLAVPGAGDHSYDRGRTAFLHTVERFGPFYENTRGDLSERIGHVKKLMGALDGLHQGQENKGGGYDVLSALLRYGRSNTPSQIIQAEGIRLNDHVICSGIQVVSGKGDFPKTGDVSRGIIITNTTEGRTESLVTTVPLSIEPFDEGIEAEIAALWAQLDSHPRLHQRGKIQFRAGDLHVRRATENLKLAAEVDVVLVRVAFALSLGCDQYGADPSLIQELTGLQLSQGRGVPKS